MLSRSRSGWAAKTCARASDSAAARRAWTGRVVSPSALIASETTACSDASSLPRWSCEVRTRSSSSTPSANISSTSTPARILMPASCSQVPIGSLHDWTSKVHGPSVSGHTVAAIRDTLPGTRCIRLGGRRTPSGSVSTTSAPSWSCPSRNTTAVTSKNSPTAAFAGWRARLTTGVTSMTGIRPTMAPDFGVRAFTQTRALGPIVLHPAGPGQAPADRIGALASRAASTTAVGQLVTRHLTWPRQRSSSGVFWIDPTTWASVLPCEPFDVSLSVRCCRSRCEPWATWPPTCGGRWHPETQDVFAAMDPDVWRESGHDPVKTAGRAHPGSPGELAADSELPADARGRPRRPRALPHRRPLVPAHLRRVRGRRIGAAQGDRLLLARSSASPPRCRSTPAGSASSRATTSRPPPTSASR